GPRAGAGRARGDVSKAEVALSVEAVVGQSEGSSLWPDPFGLVTPSVPVPSLDAPALPCPIAVGARPGGPGLLLFRCSRLNQLGACPAVWNSPRGEFSLGLTGTTLPDSLRFRSGTLVAPGSVGPKTSSDSYELCARQRSEMLAAVASPPIAYGSRWWNSRKTRSVQRLPRADRKAHWAPSRSHTARLTCAGTWRDPVLGRQPGRGFAVAASLRRATSSSSSARPLPMIVSGSPSGISRRSSS